MARSVMPSQAVHYARASVFGHGKSSRRVADGPSVAVRAPEAARSHRHGAGVRAAGDRRGSGQGPGQGLNVGVGASGESKSSRSRFVNEALQMFKSSRQRDRDSKSNSHRSDKGGRSIRAAGEDGHGDGHAPTGETVNQTSPFPQKALASFRSGGNSPGGFGGEEGFG